MCSNLVLKKKKKRKFKKTQNNFAKVRKLQIKVVPLHQENGQILNAQNLS